MAAQQTTRIREKVAFQTNVPAVVTLMYADGRESEGMYGTQWQYSLEEDKVMWVDPAVHDLIQRLQPNAGDTISITKRKPAGSKKNTWEVVPVQDEPAIAAQLEQSITNAKATTEARARAELAPAPAAAPPAALPAARSHEVTHTPAQIREANERGRQITPATARLTAALCSAVDAAAEAEIYARSRGMNLHFSSSDIRALANCSEIGEQR